MPCRHNRVSSARRSWDPSICTRCSKSLQSLAHSNRRRRSRKSSCCCCRRSCRPLCTRAQRRQGQQPPVVRNSGPSICTRYSRAFFCLCSNHLRPNHKWASCCCRHSCRHPCMPCRHNRVSSVRRSWDPSICTFRSTSLQSLAHSNRRRRSRKTPRCCYRRSCRHPCNSCRHKQVALLLSSVVARNSGSSICSRSRNPFQHPCHNNRRRPSHKSRCCFCRHSSCLPCISYRGSQVSVWVSSSSPPL